MTFYNIYDQHSETAQALGGINHIAQDHQGFLWFGGETGLGRYDSQTTKVYRHDPENPHSLSHNYIRALLVDHQGVLWIGTEGGLCRYQIALDRFQCNHHFARQALETEAVRALYLDQDNQLYVSVRSGLYRVDSAREQIRRYPLPEIIDTSPVDREIVKIVQDRKGMLWLGTFGAGLYRLNPNTGEYQHYAANDGRPDGPNHDKIQSLTLDPDDRLWIATYGGGVSVLNTDRTQFVHYVYADNAPGTLSSNVVWDVYKDRQDNLWIGIDQGGLARFDTERGFFAERHRPYDHTSLSSDQVRKIFEDANGDLWIGLFPSGVNFHNRTTGAIQRFKHQPDNPQSLSHSSILSLLQDSRGQMWVGTENGLNLLRADTQDFQRHVFGQARGLTARAVLSLAEFDENTLWVGTWSGGLLSYDMASQTFQRVDTRPPRSVLPNSQYIWHITHDRRGDLWLGTQFNGAVRYRRSTNSFQYFMHDPGNPETLSSDFVWALLEDDDGSIWVATFAGLNRLDPVTGRVQRLDQDPQIGQTLGRESTVSLFRDRDNRLWVGTQHSGVFLFDQNRQFIQRLGMEHGLPSPSISGIVEDSFGDIWLLTTKGLVRIKRADLALHLIGQEVGLAGIIFNRNAVWMAPDGYLWIGGAEGLNRFAPEQLDLGVPDFPVWITELRLMNQPVAPDELRGTLPQSTLFSPHVQLTHEDLMVSFEFAALNYRNPRGTRYAYRLQGFDPHWHDIGFRNSATYTSIPPGRYQFEVRASYGEHRRVYSAPISIHMRAAPWRSYWAYAAYSVGLMLMGYLLANYFKLKVRTHFYKTLSTTDALTGLYNRRGLTHIADHWFRAAQRTQPIAVIFMDVDHFKRINDRRGHDCGDRILRELAECCLGCIRQSDTLARWGGEEFVLLCVGVDAQGARRLADKLRAEIAQHTFDGDVAPLRVTVSLGVAQAAPNDSFEQVCKRADEALYTAKQSGRNCVVVNA